MATKDTKAKLTTLQAGINGLYQSTGSEADHIGLGDILAEMLNDLTTDVAGTSGVTSGQMKMPRKEVLAWSAADVINQYKDLRFTAANDSLLLETNQSSTGEGAEKYVAIEGTDYTVNHQVPINFTAVADVSSSLNNKYFQIGSPSENYYVWFNVGGAGVDPGLFQVTCSAITLAFTAAGSTGALYLDSNGHFFQVYATALASATAISLAGVPGYNMTAPLAPSGILNKIYTFTITAPSSGINVNAGDTYTNNGQTFTVLSSFVGGNGNGSATTMYMTGTGAPASGTLTIATGTGAASLTCTVPAIPQGDNQITYSAVVNADPALYDRTFVPHPSVAVPVAFAANATASTIATAIAAALNAFTVGSNNQSTIFQASAASAVVSIDLVAYNMLVQSFVSPSVGTSGFALSSNPVNTATTRITLKAGGALAPSGANALGNVFTVTAANATVGATYTNNSQTFTVLQTIAGATTLYMAGTGSPAASGTLTQASGTGDATITFSAVINNTSTVAQYLSNSEEVTRWMGASSAAQLKHINVAYDSYGNATSFPYWSIGSGIPIVLYPRAFNDFRALGAASIRDLSDRYQWIIPCAPDTYLSPIQGRQDLYQYNNSALFMANFIQALNLGPVHVFSSTGGAGTLVRLALNYPTLVRSIVVLAPTASFFQSALDNWVTTPAGSSFAATNTANKAATLTLFADMQASIVSDPIHGAWVATLKNVAQSNGGYPGNSYTILGLNSFSSTKQMYGDNAPLNTQYVIANVLQGNSSYPQFPAIQTCTYNELATMQTPIFSGYTSGAGLNNNLPSFQLPSQMIATVCPNAVVKAYSAGNSPEPTNNAAAALLIGVDILNFLKGK